MSVTMDNLKAIMGINADRTMLHNVFEQQKQEIIALRSELATLRGEFNAVRTLYAEASQLVARYENQLLEGCDNLTLYYMSTAYEFDGVDACLYIWAPNPDMAVAAWHATVMDRRLDLVVEDDRVWNETCSVLVDSHDGCNEGLPTYGGGKYDSARYHEVFTQVANEYRVQHFEEVERCPLTVCLIPLIPPPNPDGRATIITHGLEIIR